MFDPQILEALLGKELVPATDEQLASFESQASERGVPRSVVEELMSFYRITNGFEGLDGCDFHRCDDIILYEWWDDDELWLGQRDFYSLRWCEESGYCLGQAGDRSFSKEDEHDSLEGLLKHACKTWGITT